MITKVKIGDTKNTESILVDGFTVLNDSKTTQEFKDTSLGHGSSNDPSTTMNAGFDNVPPAGTGSGTGSTGSGSTGSGSTGSGGLPTGGGTVSPGTGMQMCL